MIREPFPLRLSAFEGPLDLLLHLIRRNRLDIHDIPIADVARQYVEHLNGMESLDTDLAGEFLVMAATLMEIKSRMLLPKPPPGDDEEAGVDPRAELVDRLLEYERYRAAAASLRELERDGRRSFPRGGIIDFAPGPSIRIDPADAVKALMQALRRLLASTPEDGDEAPTLRRDRITIRMKMREIEAFLDGSPDSVVFEALFLRGGSRNEIIVTFLALLELIRYGKIRVVQHSPLGPILVSPVARPASAELVAGALSSSISTPSNGALDARP